jgi:acetone carboxylase gamma subunit
VGDYKRYIDDEPIFRQYFCPSCGRLVENEVARAGEPALQDIELKL